MIYIYIYVIVGRSTRNIAIYKSILMFDEKMVKHINICSLETYTAICFRVIYRYFYMNYDNQIKIQLHGSKFGRKKKCLFFNKPMLSHEFIPGF